MTGSVADALNEALDRLATLHPDPIAPGVERVARVLDALGRPQDRLAPVVHVAGTNGKGSTIAFLRAMAEASGRRAHAYTSPHLVSFTERIVVAGREMTGPALLELIARVEDANAGAPITFFEITTAVALLAFAETPADVTFVEAGLGGRFDATNVFDAIACAVVTPLGLDHTEFLGDEIAQIAWHKAGVLKPDTPAVVAAQDGPARAAIAAEALAVGADLRLWGSDFRAYGEHGRLVFETGAQVMDLPAPALIGPHQIINAGTAIAAAQVLDLPESAIAAGLEHASWPGRLQRLTDGPLAEAAAPRNAEVWVDGAHNPTAGIALARAIADMDDVAPRPLLLVAGMKHGKDAAAFFRAFEGLTYEIVTTPLAAVGDHWPANALARVASQATDAPARAAKDLAHAVRIALDEAPGAPPPRVLITGSLALAGEALAMARGETPRATAG